MAIMVPQMTLPAGRRYRDVIVAAIALVQCYATRTQGGLCAVDRTPAASLTMSNASAPSGAATRASSSGSSASACATAGHPEWAGT
jgi:hypothetical protein